MYAAPPVSVRGTGGPAWRVFRALLPALGAGVLAVWLLAHAEQPAAAALSLAMASVAGGLAWWLARPRPITLAWDRQTWSLDGEPGSAQVAIDLDRWLLLRWHAQASGSGHAWAALSAAEAGAHWPLLRAALYGGPRAAAGDAAAQAGHV